MKTIKIQDVLRAGIVKRWNIVNTTRQQTLAEHLFNVAMITQAICERMEFPHLETAIWWALTHDVPEVVCGDTPTPTKNRLKSHGFDMEQIYESIDPTYATAREDAFDTQSILVVKIADLLEAVWFLKENGVGRHAKEVEVRMGERLAALVNRLPEKSQSNVNSVIKDVLFGDFYE